MSETPDLSQASDAPEEMVGPEWLNWKNQDCTQKMLLRLRESIGQMQDNWLRGVFSTREAELFARGGALALARLVDEIESIKLEIEQKEEKEG